MKISGQSIPEADVLVKRLNRLAKQNRDQFRYDIQFHDGISGVNYSFVVRETTDGHVFLTGNGDTIVEAVQDATRNIKEACQMWGYKEARKTR